MPQQTKGGSYRVGRARRERILDVATEMFAREGYSRTSLAEVARAADLTPPGLRHHFPTRQHLLLAIVERRFDRASERARSEPTDTDGTGPFRVMLHVAQMLASDPDLTEMFVLTMAESADPLSQAHTLFVSRYERIFTEIAEHFRRAAASGHLRADVDYDLVARECIAVADGLQLQWVLSGRTLDFVAMNRGHLQRLSDELRTDGRRVDLSQI